MFNCSDRGRFLLSLSLGLDLTFVSTRVRDIAPRRPSHAAPSWLPDRFISSERPISERE